MPYVIKVRRAALGEACNARGWTVDDLADRIGVSRSTVYRVFGGTTAPGTTFVAGCLRVFGVNKIDELFEFPDADEVKSHAEAVADLGTFAPLVRARESAQAFL